MNGIADSFLNYLQDNWPELIWIALAAGIAAWVAGRRGKSQWRERNFLDRLNISLTSIEDGKLRIRTILEMDGSDIFLNPVAAKAVVAFAAHTTPDNPILPIPKEDNWQYLNAVLNEISERFAVGQIRRDMGEETQCGLYLLCLTCEKAGDIRTQKIRGLLVRKDLLIALPAELKTYERPSHGTRWKTLQQIAAIYQTEPFRFIEIEICL